MRYSPGGAVDPEASHRYLRVLQVDAVGQQRLHIFIVLRLELGGRREVVEVLLDQVGHELLVKGQLMVASDDDLDVVRQGTWQELGKETFRKVEWKNSG